MRRRKCNAISTKISKKKKSTIELAFNVRHFLFRVACLNGGLRIKMTRGNQRDKAREKALKKQKQQKKSSAEKDVNKGSNLQTRKERDADRMREKQQAAAAKKELESKGACGGK
ncbi:modifier of protein aggregation 4-like [Saccoglossus kowalevskii]